ncbi:glycyl-radical enzyme activating protein [Labilibacter marinus]|uniref:glycyl-radical enzyme activating protein n=1 Tax=Labilibacter marinus TaxID=1477105 RepID=UPI00094F4C64|nr:glycyl-radical enzyme activating protein [Labilibacter marinus]
MNKGLIYKIDRLNTHNGSGFRTVIYFKGCPLHCSWCHNPEGINPKPEVWINSLKCMGCGTCISQCPEQALGLIEKGVYLNREKCTGCQLCVNPCPTIAIEPLGAYYTVDDLMKIILQDKMLFETSGGGVTVTGGEPGMQSDFVVELLKACQDVGVNTALDTSGVVSLPSLGKMLQYCNTVFVDIKLFDDQASKYYTGLPLKKLKETIKYLNNYKKDTQNLNIEIRTPLIPGVNDDNESLKKIASFIQKTFTHAPKWELCMFNDLCEDKYNRMNMAWGFKGKKHAAKDYERINHLKESLPIDVTISGFVERNNKD